MANDPIPGPMPNQSKSRPNPNTAQVQTPQEVLNSIGTILPAKELHPTPDAPKQQEPIAPPLPPKEVAPKFFEEEKPNEPASAEGDTVPKTENATDDDLDAVDNPGAEHFKVLREKWKTTKSEAKLAREKAEELEQKVQKYETGEATPEVIKAKDEEIARLSTYEKVVNLRGSKEYKDKFLSPLKSTTDELKAIFTDYGIPEENLDAAVNMAVNTKSRRELDEFLSSVELGPASALEAKNLVDKARTLHQGMQGAESNAGDSLTAFQAEAAETNQRVEQERRGKIIKSAESAWVEELTAIRSEGKLTELIHRDDDPEFNANFPDKLIPQAAAEYGKLITKLGLAGADLPREVTNALAKMVLLAHSAGVAIETRNRSISELDSITNNLDRQHAMIRPPMGGGVPRGNGGIGPKQAPPTAAQDAESLISKVMGGRK